MVSILSIGDSNIMKGRYGKPVTDPETLARLNVGMNQDQIQNQGTGTYGSSVTDPELLKRLSGSNQEDFLTSLSQVPRRVGEDIYQVISNAFQKAPSYLEKGKTEVPGLAKVLLQHPLHALGQAAAGIPEMGHNILNTPHELGEYLSKRLHLLPEAISESIPYQKDISSDINQLFGEPKYEGESLLRGITRNLPNIYGATSVATKFNPLKLTKENIIKDILKSEEKMKQKYSGPSGLYTKLFGEAKNRGIGGVNFNKDLVERNAKILSENSPERFYKSLNNFIGNNSLENSQKAISDLGYLERKLSSQSILTNPEKDVLRAVIETKKHLQDNMFKDKTGKVHQDLANRHEKIQQGYANEVIPYSKSIPLQKYKRKKLTVDQVMQSLSKGEFAAKRGKYHNIGTRESIKNALIGLGIGGGIVGGSKTLWDYLSGEK